MFHVLRNRLVVGFLTGTLAIYLLAQAVDGQRLIDIFIESLARFDLLLRCDKQWSDHEASASNLP